MYVILFVPSYFQEHMLQSKCFSLEMIYMFISNTESLFHVVPVA